ncbi:LOW QUALITY PROTEIN: serine protease 29-like [Choloepus didactylus]|uniref:LOW QUALITY PROTEIN: serine protease 29-like n=1 Tax=Choloepus didactylus TaxID=27675 RepID=UPI00189E9B5E|nr:LOW QUALITY PROTEIN: serine protease 29-like [Choloepus didactylus]
MKHMNICVKGIDEVSQTQKQLLSSSLLTPSIPPLPISNEIPWLVSMSGNCHGIILSRWWILSTANCLQKMKPSHLNISRVIDPNGILHGQRICLHPNFDPQIGEHPAKANIGVVLLEEPIYEHDVPLSQLPNITWKICSKCQYRQCQIYQYQGINEFGSTRVKKVSVQLLDLSKCQHQHSHLAETEGSCIQSQEHQGCWVQQGSPVLCLLKRHWELVGLVHESSKMCHDPTVIIRTAPYFTWMKQFIKASKKRLILTSSLHCKTSTRKIHTLKMAHGFLFQLVQLSHGIPLLNMMQRDPKINQ